MIFCQTLSLILSKIHFRQACNLKRKSVVRHVINIMLHFRPNPELKFIDHIVGNMPNNEMEATVQWYSRNESPGSYLGIFLGTRKCFSFSDFGLLMILFFIRIIPRFVQSLSLMVKRLSRCQSMSLQ